ncbi:putative pectinesterase/pectinesterase inhibitor 28 [Wolffia australiana]
MASGGKKLAAGGTAAVLLIAVVATVAVITVHRQSSTSAASSPPSDSVRAIQSICQPTDFPGTCEKTLTEAAPSNLTDPSQLIQLSFSVTIDHLRALFNQSALLKSLTSDPRTKHALDNCDELLDYAVNDLVSSVEKLGNLDSLAKLSKATEDLKVWLSAAITYEETCLDGFENATGNAGETMRKAMNVSMELTQNALAIVDDLSSLFGSLAAPAPWADPARRRLLAESGGVAAADIVVAKDGSGDYVKINDALLAVPKKSAKITVIYVKEGIYEETVQVNRSLINLVMIGDGYDKARITGSLNFVDGTPTFKTATFAVVGDGFMAKNIGFENSAGAAKHQAVALRVGSDRAIFYNCSMDGYQDTLYAHTKRQFYRDCTISGTIDFVFGNAAAVFQNCVFKVRKPLDNQQNIVTAQGRKDVREPTAMVLHNCTITADPVYFPARMKLKSYLGRPWKEYSRTIVVQSQIDDLIDPQGWLPWLGDFGLSTCFYSEFGNRGVGAGLAKRAAWPGVKKIDYKEVLGFSVENFIQGDSWLKSSGVPYYLGLLPNSH